MVWGLLFLSKVSACKDGQGRLASRPYNEVMLRMVSIGHTGIPWERWLPAGFFEGYSTTRPYSSFFVCWVPTEGRD